MGAVRRPLREVKFLQFGEPGALQFLGDAVDLQGLLGGTADDEGAAGVGREIPVLACGAQGVEDDFERRGVQATPISANCGVPLGATVEGAAYRFCAMKAYRAASFIGSTFAGVLTILRRLRLPMPSFQGRAASKVW